VTTYHKITLSQYGERYVTPAALEKTIEKEEHDMLMPVFEDDDCAADWE
jgi:hypothetical protein